MRSTTGNDSKASVRISKEDSRTKPPIQGKQKPKVERPSRKRNQLQAPASGKWTVEEIENDFKDKVLKLNCRVDSIVHNKKLLLIDQGSPEQEQIQTRHQ